MTQNVEKVYRHVPEETDGVSYDIKCREGDRHAPALIDGVSNDTKCTESRETLFDTNSWCFF